MNLDSRKSSWALANHSPVRGVGSLRNLESMLPGLQRAPVIISSQANASYWFVSEMVPSQPDSNTVPLKIIFQICIIPVIRNFRHRRWDSYSCAKHSSLCQFNGQKNEMVKEFHSSFNMQLLCITASTVKKDISNSGTSFNRPENDQPFLATWQSSLLLRPGLHGKRSDQRKCALTLSARGWQTWAAFASGVKMEVVQRSPELSVAISKQHCHGADWTFY